MQNIVNPMTASTLTPALSQRAREHGALRFSCFLWQFFATKALTFSLILCSSALAHPLITVGRVSVPPKIDGSLDDEAWKHAIVLSDYTLMNVPIRASQQTEARVLYDQDALYLGFRCYEIVLQPAQQRVHEFRAQHGPETLDERIWNEDGVEVFLSPHASGRPYCHFIVNARGARFDGKGKGDNSWNPVWQAAAKRFDAGYFDIEARIPFSSFGAGPRTGRLWRAQFCRNRRPKQAFHSAWPPPVGGYHEPANFAHMRFVPRELPEVRFPGFVEFAGVGGAKIISTGLQACIARVYVAGLADEKGPALTRTLDDGGCDFGPLRSALAEKIQSPGRYDVLLKLLEPDGNTVLLETPVARWLLGTYEARMTITKRGQIQLAATVNGQPVDIATGHLRLRPGKNLIALHATRKGDGAIRTAFTVQGRTLSRTGWRAYAGQLDSWDSPALDDSGWSFASDLGDSWMWQGASAELLLRRWVSIPATGYCSPGHTPTHLARGAAQLLTFALDGSGDPKEFWFELTLPPFIRLMNPLDAEGRPGLSAIRHERIVLPDGRVRHRLDLSNGRRYADGFGGELQWSTDEGGMFYHRLLRFAGSSDWRTVKTVVRAPALATSARLWFLKWPRLSGRLEFDDVSLRKVGSDVELVSHGDMEGQFKQTWLTGRARRRAGPDGNHFMQMNAEPEAVGQQIWFRCKELLPIEGGHEYVFSCRARWNDVKQPRTIRGDYPLVVQVDENAPEGKATISYGWSSARGAMTMLDHELRCVVGPRIEGKQPKGIMFVNWPSWSYGYPLGCLANAAQLQAMADQWQRCGLNVLQDVPLRREFSVSLRSRFALLSTLHWHNSGAAYERAIDSFLRHREDARATTFSGALHVKRACPTYLLSSEGKALREVALSHIRREVRALPCDIYCTDYEVPISAPPTICFDARCIAAFRKFASIPAQVELTPQILIGKHIEKWTDFQLRNNLAILRTIQDAIKDVRPDAKYMVYSGYHCQYTKEHYGVDWELMRPAMDIACAGYGRSPLRVADTVEALGHVPLVGGVLENRRCIRPFSLGTRTMRCVLDCGGGVMLFYDTVVDARFHRAIADASLVAAEFEDLIKHGTRDDGLVRASGEFVQGDACVYDGPKRRLVVLFNERSTERRGTLELLALPPSAKARAFPSGKAVKGPTFAVRIEPRTYRAYDITK